MIINIFFINYTNANKKSQKDTSEESKIPMQDITNRKQPKRGKRKNTTKIEECKMKLAERRTADRKAQAEIEKLELENLKLRKELNM
ncbi:unnamed protein product [Rhizophagus irregularis]|nr:unnamed protein product [Rhizophagus irregularis]